MTNNNPTDIARLITYLETQLASREESIARRNRFLADPENRQYIDDLATFVLQTAEQVAKASGINLALQEAKAIAEGY